MATGEKEWKSFLSSWGGDWGQSSRCPAQGQEPEPSPPRLKGILNSSVSWIYIIYGPFFIVVVVDFKKYFFVGATLTPDRK